MISTKLLSLQSKNLQHNNTQEKCGSLEGRNSLPFKVVQTVEIEFERGDDQWFKFELRGIHVHTQVNQ